MIFATVQETGAAEEVGGEGGGAEEHAGDQVRAHLRMEPPQALPLRITYNHLSCRCNESAKHFAPFC